MTTLAHLLADCEARGIRLLPSGDGRLTIEAPEAELTADLLAGLKIHKAELLRLLTPALDGPASAPMRKPMPAWRCRCGSTDWQDVPIHPAGLRPLRAVHCVRGLVRPATGAGNMKTTAWQARGQTPTGRLDQRIVGPPDAADGQLGALFTRKRKGPKGWAGRRWPDACNKESILLR
jgi:hypothetical protein